MIQRGLRNFGKHSIVYLLDLKFKTVSARFAESGLTLKGGDEASFSFARPPLLTVSAKTQ